MIPIPLEVLTMGASSVIGGILKIMDAKSQATDRMLAALNKDAHDRASLGTPSYQFTRRTIALTVTFAVILLPKLAALGGLPVTYGSTEEVSYLWGLFGNSASTVWYTVGGMPITPLDTHAFAAIIGLYFGFGGKR